MRKRPGGIGPDITAVTFLGSSVLHAVVPAFFENLMPPAIPRKREIVYVTGAMEAALAVGLLRRWRWAGPASAALLVAVFPANLQTVLDAGSGRQPGPMDDKRVALARLPLQLPLIWWAWQTRKKS